METAGGAPLKTSSQFTITISTDTNNNDQAILDQIEYAISNKEYVTAVKLCLPLVDKLNSKASCLLLDVVVQGCDSDDVFNYCSDQKDASPAATIALGYWYLIGRADVLNYNEVKLYLDEEATKDHPLAQYGMGCLYIHGYGVGRDDDKAFDYFQLSASKGGFLYAQYRVGEMLMNGYGVGQKNGATYRSLEDVNSEAFHYLKLAADQGVADAQHMVGSTYLKGLNGVAKNYDEAFKYLKLAADQKHPVAQNDLGFMYHDGLGVKQNNEEAVKYYTLSSNQKNAVGQYNLGTMYLNGTGIDRDSIKARVYFELARQQMHKDAAYELDNMLWRGDGVIDPDSASEARYIAFALEMGMSEYDIIRNLNATSKQRNCTIM